MSGRSMASGADGQQPGLAGDWPTRGEALAARVSIASTPESP